MFFLRVKLVSYVIILICILCILIMIVGHIIFSVFESLSVIVTCLPSRHLEECVMSHIL